MPQVDWSYHRPGWKTCVKTQEFLAKHKIEAAEQVDAKKRTFKKNDALALARDVDEIYASKNKRLIHVDLKKDKPDTDTLAGLLLGPTGNLRAPTVRKGRTLIVGFDEATYKKVLK